VVIAGTLLVAFSLAGGLGIVNNTPAIVAGWVGFAVTLLAAYWTAPAGPSERARPCSTEGG